MEEIFILRPYRLVCLSLFFFVNNYEDNWASYGNLWLIWALDFFSTKIMPLSEYVSNAQHVVDVTLGTSDAYDYKMFDDTGDIF